MLFPKELTVLKPEGEPCDDGYNPDGVERCRYNAEYVVIAVVYGKYYRNCVCKAHKTQMLATNKQVFDKFYIFKRGELLSIV